MKKPIDIDVQELMERNSIKTTVISYAMTLVYAAVSAVSAMAGREMIETITTKLLITQELEAAQYGGIRRISQIVAMVLMVGLWLTTFMIVWHKIEHASPLKKRMTIGAIWIGSAVVAYFVFALAQYIVVGYWPMLTGAV